MSNIYLASIYLADNESIEHLSDLKLHTLKTKVFIFLKDYIGSWYPELLEKLSMPRSIECLIDEDDEVYMQRLSRLLKHIKKYEQVKISFFRIDTSTQEKEICNDLDILI